MRAFALLAVGLWACGIGGAAALKCAAGDYACVNTSSFCLKGQVMMCAAGTVCTGSVAGASPCTQSKASRYERCNGPYADRACCDSKHFCKNGYKVKCPVGTSCYGSRNGENPCKFDVKVQAALAAAAAARAAALPGAAAALPKPAAVAAGAAKPVNAALPKQPVVGAQLGAGALAKPLPKPSGLGAGVAAKPAVVPPAKVAARSLGEGVTVQLAPTAITTRTWSTKCGRERCDDHEDCDSDCHRRKKCDRCEHGCDDHGECRRKKKESCGGGDWKCTSDTTYCEGGHTIKCPLDTVCQGWAPCVKRSSCPKYKDCPECSGKGNFTCINDRDFCNAGECQQCPDGTRCTGSESGKSPCTQDVPPAPCPGPYDDFQCIDSRRYCQDGMVMTCPNSGYCHGIDGEAPCKSTPPSGPTCTVGDNKCIDGTHWCDGDLQQSCPEGTICKGGFPCSTSTDMSCSESDGTCLDWNDFCMGKERLTCPDGYKCGKAEAPGMAPCISESSTERDEPPCWAPVDDYTCLDASHYCLDDNSMWCGSDKYCNPRALDDDQPICQSAAPPNPTCTQGLWECITDTSFCHKGLAIDCPEDFVCKGLPPFPCVQRCSCDDDTCHDDACRKDKHEKPDCGDNCDDHSRDRCWGKPDWSCHDDRGFCRGGKEWRCPHGHRCRGGGSDDQSCCEPDDWNGPCDGPRTNYECIDDSHYCLGGHRRSCPHGTWCAGSAHGESPCKGDDWDPRPERLCDGGDGVCLDRYTYCSGGCKYSCRGGMVCEGYAPCSWPTEEVPQCRDPTSHGCWNDCDQHPDAPGCWRDDDPCSHGPHGCEWKWAGGRDKECDCADKGSTCYDRCCADPDSCKPVDDCDCGNPSSDCFDPHNCYGSDGTPSHDPSWMDGSQQGPSDPQQGPSDPQQGGGDPQQGGRPTDPLGDPSAGGGGGEDPGATEGSSGGGADPGTGGGADPGTGGGQEPGGSGGGSEGGAGETQPAYEEPAAEASAASEFGDGGPSI